MEKSMKIKYLMKLKVMKRIFTLKKFHLTLIPMKM